VGIKVIYVFSFDPSAICAVSVVTGIKQHAPSNALLIRNSQPLNFVVPIFYYPLNLKLF